VLCMVQFLESLDRVQNAALRTCLGAFRTSPVASLHVEAGELPLELRRQQLCLQYVCKLRSNSCNPAFNSVFGTGFRRLFEARPNTIPTLSIRLNQSVVESEINLNSIAVNSTRFTPPCLLKTPGFQLFLHLFGNKSRGFSYCSPIKIQRTSLYDMVILTFSLMDLKSGDAVGSAAIVASRLWKKRLTNNTSIFLADARGILYWRST